jgi:hypothetical protein
MNIDDLWDRIAISFISLQAFVFFLKHGILSPSNVIIPLKYHNF